MNEVVEPEEEHRQLLAECNAHTVQFRNILLSIK
jgi:hypothetical protein